MPGGLESGGLESGGLESGGLESRATDFGSGSAHTWGSRVWGSRVWGSRVWGSTQVLNLRLGQRISDLVAHMPVLRKSYIEPFTRASLFREHLPFCGEDLIHQWPGTNFGDMGWK